MSRKYNIPKKKPRHKKARKPEMPVIPLEIRKEMVKEAERSVRRITQEENERYGELAVMCACLISCLTLRDRYGFGRKRMEQFVREYRSIYDSLGSGYELGDIVQVLKEEVGLDVLQSLGVEGDL